MRSLLDPHRRGRSHLARATALTLMAGTLLLGGASSSAASVLREPTEDPSLDQSVSGAEVTVEENAVVDAGHVDLGPRLIDGEWRMQARDDRTVPPVWRFLDTTVVHVMDAGIIPAPESPDYSFLGTEAGAPVYVIPQTQNQEVVWLGWNTQDPEITQRIDRGATLTLDGVTGPGNLFLFLQEGVTGPPNLLWDSTAAGPQDLWMEVNTHTHANWVFTEPGVYLVEVTMRATFTDGAEVSDSGTLRFAVGSQTDPQSAFPVAAEAEATEPTEPATAPAEPAPEDAPDTAADAVPVDDDEPTATRDVALWAGVVGLALVVAVVASVLRSRRARARVDAESEVSDQ